MKGQKGNYFCFQKKIASVQPGRYNCKAALLLYLQKKSGTFFLENNNDTTHTRIKNE